MCALESQQLESTRKPMFVTFYSYKGGVGRTLALANVAALLARDAEEPCRVLVWDFDLPAPGLQDVIKCKWGERKIGFVDYLDRYLQEAALDDIAKYIHKTSIPGVDMLPAGSMGRQYAQRLEEIQWQEIYEEAQGFQFIAETKSQIAKLQPAYDYVLIDSLTGYSDGGGICVNQLADTVVLLFRLNHQNIKGISRVFRSVIAHARPETTQSEPTNVVPVISPAWPFAASESNEWFKRAKKVFGNRRIFTISFEGSMMLGEKVLSAADEQYAIEPPVLRDYRVLTRHIRSLNPRDLKTVYRLAERSQEQNQFDSAIEWIGTLVERRPDVERYWRELATSVQMAPAGIHKKILPTVHAIIRKGCEAQKAWAYVAKAWLAETIDGDWNAVLDNYGKAIHLEPQNANFYFLRGLSEINHDQSASAIHDLSKAIELNLQSSRLPWAFFLLGRSYRELGEPDKALGCFSKAMKSLPTEFLFLQLRALTLYSLGRYAESAADLEKAIRIDPSRAGLKILRAHVAAALGEIDEARQSLEALAPQVELEPITLLNLAEAYLVVSPVEAINVLKANPAATLERPTVAAFLRKFADILMGREEEHAATAIPVEPSEQKVSWSLTELREFLKWGKASGRINEAQHAKLLQLIDKTGWSPKNPTSHDRQ